MTNTSTRAVVAAAALLAATAHAQSSVTLFGTVDVGITHLRADGGSTTGVSHSNANISRWGFKGEEDLGNGLKAGFHLEAGFSPDTGTPAAAGGFNRRATVSLHGGFGEIRLGRDDSASFLNTLIFDPFLTNGVGGTHAFLLNGAPTIQISNAVSYFLPQGLGGFYGQIQHAFSERAAQNGGARGGEYNGIRAGWRQGAWHAAGSAARLNGTDKDSDQRFANLALSYDLGVARPMLLLAQHKRGDVEVRGLQLGVKVPLGSGEIRASVARYDTRKSDADWNKFALGYAHNLSKRTQLYTTLAHVSNSKGAQRTVSAQGLAAPANTSGHNASGFEIGMRHFF